ncbi:hypothetical protein [Streptomyces litchfieldiae]|uniref:Uncharacterized protein n=1 Tax=Streptomyces litchfieldiae TaxID=3075543 RepID=A0ABU2MYF8_9ACTN|nr:hypothetical protein [Streptomyces sp. DSM 44938]MDT0346682.1 hypothetical protein [Streptomyces sp. DSM 44938]
MAENWESLTAALLITKSELNSAALTERLGVGPDFFDEAGCWGLRAAAADVPSVLDALLPRVEPLIAELAALREEGHRVRIGISGGIDRVRRLTVPAESLARVARLGLPLAFIPESAAGNETEEFLDSLLAANDEVSSE